MIPTRPRVSRTGVFALPAAQAGVFALPAATCRRGYCACLGSRIKLSPAYADATYALAFRDNVTLWLLSINGNYGLEKYV